MAAWWELVKGNPVEWLLEPDGQNPGVRYLALRDLESFPADSYELIQAKNDAFSRGTIAAILAKIRPEGYWVKPGSGYGPKFTGSVWSLMILAQLGADVTHPKVQRAAEYLLEHTISPVGWFSYNGMNPGLLHCHAGYVAATMLDIEAGQDAGVKAALEWHARIITGIGIAKPDSQEVVRYYRYAPGPDFICSANAGKTCAWGVVKTMNAMGRVPYKQRSNTMQKAIDMGRRFLFETDLAICDFPTRDKTQDRTSWFKLGFPMVYSSDVLEILEVLTRLGYGADARLQGVWDLVLDKQDDQGRWPMESSHNGKMWADIEEKGRPSKWVTLRVLRVLKAAFPA
ncbi:MAG: nitrogen fixation protein NifH [Dehalogenimonas sp.]